MPNLLEFALGMVRKNPNVVNNPQAQSYIDTIQSGDKQKIEQLARNLCQTYGVSVEEAAKQARNYFHI